MRVACGWPSVVVLDVDARGGSMWVFLSSRLRQWAILSVAVPLTLAGLRWLRRRIEARTGPNRLTRGLANVDTLASKVTGRERPTPRQA
jgi:hypothetical protein